MSFLSQPLHKPSGGFGGAERLALNLAPQLSRRGYEVSFYWSVRLEGSFGGSFGIRRISWGSGKLTGALSEMERADVVLVVHTSNLWRAIWPDSG